mmetsp:Transcript_16346/g.33670  ORF Transcript_16346/g.33670 Transcript_16346/m.33670 type:complete len:216 (+) Transcript_16346:69-716(+)|eukprot:CAMPEP_0197264462 /NCGR_PEP_ID=MMETSP1432-20130617/1808_1 /TAXON_ID=44447 /ORGANISM="Pseudo-nitzschia delicatissima, Strain UNC1205" /LENGTH=215 /DNA_ID=CAMNT_0042729109 /DNA_START=56 /DNA_END=703 /DNA_ORIENTATION=-
MPKFSMSSILTDVVSTSALLFLLLQAATTTHAFQIFQPARIMMRQVDAKTHLGAFSFHSAGSLLISEDVIGGQASDAIIATPTDSAIAAASDTAEAFTDKIDYFGDPMIRTLFLVFGGVVLLLAGLSVLSQKVDSAIESVIVDFESVLRTDPEFRTKWQDIAPQLEQYETDANELVDTENELKRKQKLFEIMEEMQEKEPGLMKRINSKMEARRT